MNSLPSQIIYKWQTAYNNHDSDKATALYRENVINTQHPWPNPVLGRVAMKKTYDNIFNAFPDIHIEIEHLVEQGLWVVAEWRFGGTMKGTFASHKPTNKTFDMRGCEIFQIIDGKIHEQHGYWDKATMFAQLGLPLA